MNLEELKNAIHSCLDKLYENDSYLIMNSVDTEPKHVSERSIVFRFGVYFENFVREQLSEYNLDSEYNRNKADIKLLPSWEDGCYPDIIVHKRGNNDNNLLVIEFKTWWNSDQSNDCQKIIEFCSTDTYQYKYGMTILLGKNRKNVKVRLYKKETSSWTDL